MGKLRGFGCNPACAWWLDGLTERWRPDLWVNSHLHDSCDYRIADTRVICNPAGFGSVNLEFEPRLVVDL